MTLYANTAKGEPWARRGGANAAGFPQYTVWENTFDAAERNLAEDDGVDPLIVIPANTLVQGVFVEVLTPEASTTIDVGDTTDPNGFVAAQSGAVAGMFAGGGAYIAADTDTTALQIPKLYTADTDLQAVVAGAAATVLRFRVVVVGVNLG
tara:strand:+ start:7848 stop:8300 length:453 start_codon:yes stop_codon:yes gene_type:complete